MAKYNPTSSDNLRRFDTELSEDRNDFHLDENAWTQARNAINNSKTGDIGKLGNEPGNQYCTEATYTLIGAIHTEGDVWVLFSTDETNSEIGLFKEGTCTYLAVANSTCLNFTKYNLIRGVSRSTSNCNWRIYWDDGINPSRFLTIKTDDFNANLYSNPNSPIPWIQNCLDENGNDPNSPLYPQGCITCTNTPNIDCDKIRLAPFVETPCVAVQKSNASGTLANGSYFATIAYCLEGQRVTDYFTPSNVLPLFDHDNIAGAIDVTISNTDTSFDEFELVIVSLINSQTVAKRIGIYNITQDKVTLDTIDPALITVSIDLIPLRTPVFDKTDAMYTVSDYLIRVGPTTKFDFNYQPLANQIVTKWQAVEYPSTYYQRGGTNTGYMRDEVYAFFIRWIYDTGDKTPSYHIPGRPAKIYTPLGLTDTAPFFDANNSLVGDTLLFETVNTAEGILVSNLLPDGGTVIAEGTMGYWQSTEYYPNNNAEVWNASANTWSQLNSIPYTGTSITDYDLCGEHIRHHKFPDNISYGADSHHYSANGTTIRIMGVAFENIRTPVDNQGNAIPNIVGYEILRSSRKANKTVIAKGIINNMRLYDIPDQPNIKGAFQNYPYNDLRQDPFLSTTQTSWASGREKDYNGQTQYSQTLFSFHSPDTTFVRPFLGNNELKMYSQYYGNVEGEFEWSEQHPKFKILRNFAFYASAVTGIGIAALAMNGQRTYSREQPRMQATGPIAGGTTDPISLAAAIVAATSASGTYASAVGTGGILTTSSAFLIANLLAGLNQTNIALSGYDALAASYLSLPQLIGGTKNVNYSDTAWSALPFPLRLAGTVSGRPGFSYYWTEGTNQTLDLIKAFSKYRNFALKYNSHGFYNNYLSPISTSRRRQINEQSYVGPDLLDFTSSVRINNLFRNKFVALDVTRAISDPTSVDITRQLATEVPSLPGYSAYNVKDPTNNSPFTTNTSCHYTAIKQRIRNQYGQIDSIQQVPVNSCIIAAKSGKPIPNSGTLFGGDVYIGRYTEKNTFFFFYNWLYNQPDGYEFNYDDYKMIPYPRFWLNSDQFDASDFTESLISNPFQPSLWQLPNDYYNLDNLSFSFWFTVRNAYYYLFNSGIRDFFVETEINIDFRDWGEFDSQKHYPIITDLKTIFDTNIIKSGNFYKYDQSLSITKTLPNLVSWGNVQPRNYSPYLAETCYIYQKNRVIYSLRSQFESSKDYWRVFLVNNYYDFKQYVTNIKSVNKSGAMIFFDTASPIQFQGTDQLETDLGTKLTIGDGGLFSQPLQSIVNTDAPYEYGSCQDTFSVINTALGLYWISQNQGKIFRLTSGVEEVSLDNMKWWLAQYLPYQLLQQNIANIQNFELSNNPVAGIGCQSTFDNQNQIVYFCKRDYTVKKDLPANISLTYLNTDQFQVNTVVGGESLPINTITLGDPLYFEDASWTISYDPKTQGFISYHDWHPTLTLPGKNTFMSVNPEDKKSIWIHNERCDLYANYYGKDYPFEVEWMVNTANVVTSLRSIEYQLEVYKYAPNCYDRFHKLDTNFDEAVVYNTEQCSGLLKLNLTPRNNAPAILNYPIINLNNIQILFSKIEQKYRFNQFWDVTRDRGEFPIGSPYPPPTPNVGSYAQQTIWNTAANGYIRTLNSNNLNYNKESLQRKKFRHYSTSVLLRKLVSGDSKFLVMTSTNKNLYSPR